MAEPQALFTDGEHGTYHFVRSLARGGMGEVELAVRRKGAFKRFYALKRLRPEFRNDEKFRRMFLDEARVAGLITHPNVVSVVDVGEDKRGPYLVMDFVRGMTARALLTVARDELLPSGLVVHVIQQAAAGLAAAHALQDDEGQPLDLVHRDISPQNLLVGFDGIVRVTDFGIARALGRSSETTTGILKGKTGYLSPEQLRFEKLDFRSDLFALGVVFYELLSGARLYSGKDISDIAGAILRDPPPDIETVRKDVHPAVVELLFELLAKHRDDRPASTLEVSERLASVVHQTVDGPPRQLLQSFMATHFVDPGASGEYFAVQPEEPTRRASPLAGEEPTQGSSVRRITPRLSARLVGAMLLVSVGVGVGVALLQQPRTTEENAAPDQQGGDTTTTDQTDQVPVNDALEIDRSDTAEEEEPEEAILEEVTAEEEEVPNMESDMRRTKRIRRSRPNRDVDSAQEPDSVMAIEHTVAF